MTVSIGKAVSVQLNKFNILELPQIMLALSPRTLLGQYFYLLLEVFRESLLT